MTLKKLNILNSFLLLIIFIVLAFVVNDVIIYKRAVKGFKVSQVSIVTDTPQVSVKEYAAIVEEPVFPGKAQHFTPSISSEIVNLTTAPADTSGILKKIKLTGTYVSQNRSQSFAVLTNTEEQRQESFRRGDNVFGLGTLSSVTKERVTIQAGTKEYLFEMPATEKATEFTPVLRQSSGRSPAGTIPGQRKDSEYTRKISETEWVINQEAVQSAMDDMSSLLSDARMTPVSTKGHVEGFRVTEIRPQGVFDAIGLKNNDVLKRVNNYDMSSPERAIQVLSALKGERNFTIDIERDGKKMSLNYQVR